MSARSLRVANCEMCRQEFSTVRPEARFCSANCRSKARWVRDPEGEREKQRERWSRRIRKPRLERVAKEALLCAAAETAQRLILERSASDENGCWVWQMHLHPDGYGFFSHAGHRHYAHRAAYIAFRGQIPEGLTIDHLCGNKACVNPFHMEPVTNRENNLRGMSRSGQNVRAVHCPKGHPYDEHNTVFSKSGGRWCRKCAAEYQRNLRSRKKAMQ